LVQVVECLPSKHKALSSSSSTEKKKLFVWALLHMTVIKE
jgi:hypothetical protein